MGPLSHQASKLLDRIGGGSSVPIGVTVEAGTARIGISRYLAVVVVNGILVVVLVAIDTTEGAEITWARVTIHAGVPFPIVISAVDREILGVVVEG